jgi:hypothetical protein
MDPTAIRQEENHWARSIPGQVFNESGAVFCTSLTTILTLVTEGSEANSLELSPSSQIERPVSFLDLTTCTRQVVLYFGQLFSPWGVRHIGKMGPPACYDT